MNWWNSADAISSASTIAQVVVAAFGILALVLGIRASHLQDLQQQQNQVDIARAKSEAASANERAAALESQTASARLALEKLKLRQAPWVFTDAQKARLTQLLAKAPKGNIEIAYLLADADRLGGLARYLEQTFRNAGFVLGPEIGILSNPGNPTGINVVYLEEQDRDRSRAYSEIFSSLGIPCEWGKRDPAKNPPDPRFKNPVTIRIYGKPSEQER